MKDAAAAHERMAADVTAIVAAADAIGAALKNGRSVLVFGNGGSAAEAQHLAAELVNRMTRNRPALPAVALATDGSTLTSIANDSAYEQVFARQIEALGKPEDIAFALSTSGDSPNILRGLESARERGLLCVALLGRDGGRARKLTQIALVAESSVTARIQEAHLFAGHLFCEEVERILFPPAP